MHYHHRNSISIISSNSFLILLKLKGRFWGLTLKDKNCPVDIFSDKIFPCNICAGACHKKRSTDLIWQIEIKLGFRDSHLQATLDICPGNICPGHVYIVLTKQKLLTLFSSNQPPPTGKKLAQHFLLIQMFSCIQLHFFITLIIIQKNNPKIVVLQPRYLTLIIHLNIDLKSLLLFSSITSPIVLFRRLHAGVL